MHGHMNVKKVGLLVVLIVRFCAKLNYVHNVQQNRSTLNFIKNQ